MNHRLLACCLALLAATACRKPESLEALIARGDAAALAKRLEGVDVDKPARDGRTLLAHAVVAGKREVIAVLVAAGADAQTRGPQGTLLHLAAEEGTVESLAALIAAGAPVDAANGRGETALHVAAWKGRLPIVEALLQKHDADASRKTIDGHLASELALAAGHTEVWELLVGGDAIRLDPKRLAGVSLENAIANFRAFQLLNPLKDGRFVSSNPDALAKSLLDCQFLRPIETDYLWGLEAPDLMNLYYSNAYLCLPRELGPLARSKTYHDEFGEGWSCTARSTSGALLARALDRTAASIESLWARYKEVAFAALPAERYRKLQGDNVITRLLESDEALSKHENRDELLAAAFKKLEAMHANPENQDATYGLPWCDQLSELWPDSEVRYYQCWEYGFWVRRHAEGNTEIVRKILVDVRTHYAKLPNAKTKPPAPNCAEPVRVKQDEAAD